MKNVGIVYDPIYAKHDTGQHPERIDRVLTTLDVLKQQKKYGSGAPAHYKALSPRKSSLEELLWAHSSSLVNEIKDSSEEARHRNESIYMDGDTPVSGASYEASLYSSGGNLAAIDAILKDEINRAFIICRPPGHHSNRNSSRGFCLFNNIAIAINYLLRIKKLERVAVLDFDCHAGNGTEEIFEEGPSEGELLFISTHQDPHTLYPGTCFIEDMGSGKQRGKIMNITFAPRSGDDCMGLALDQLIIPTFKEFKPQFILFSAGFDAWRKDPLTNLGFTQQGFGKIIQKIDPIAEQFAHGRMLATLEGGYNLKALANSITNVISCMAQDPMVFIEENVNDDPQLVNYTENELIPSIKKLFRPYWASFN